MTKRTISYRQAINEALHQLMEHDKRVFTYGIDVADHKRIFGSTAGLVEAFGPERCFSTPLCEDTLVGFGLGAAINGLRPINVHMRVDFLLLAMNQLINMVACHHYGSNGQVNVPFVIRAVIGKGWGQAYQHSKSLQSFFAHIPGLKVVMPTTPQAAKHALIAGVQDNNPVVIIEHRLLYDTEDHVDATFSAPALGKATIVNQGQACTVVATSYLIVEALHAAQIIKKHHNIDIDVIDPYCINPLDINTLCESVNKTGHCIIADYDWLNCGFSAELATQIGEHCFDTLKSPIKRLGFQPAHCPTTRPLEDLFYPNAENITRAIEAKLKLPKANLNQEVFFNYENKFKGPF